MRGARQAIVQRLAVAHAVGGCAAAVLWMVSPILMLGMWGVLLAALDWYAAGSRIEERGRWLLGGAMGGVVAVAPGYGVMLAVDRTLAGMTRTGPIGASEALAATVVLMALAFGATGLAVGLGQEAGLRHRVHGWGRWGLAQAAGGAVTGLLMVLAWQALLGEHGLRLVGDPARGPAGTAWVTVGGAVGGLVGGAVSGACLDWLLRSGGRGGPDARPACRWPGGQAAG